jgi:DNA-binding CsgD family transcriptional regulator
MSFQGSPLTARERQVLAMAAGGKTLSEIGESLGLTTRTVQEHIDMTVRKTGAGSAADAVAIFLKSGLVRE